MGLARGIYEAMPEGVKPEQSKQFPDNRPEAFEMSGFEIDRTIETPYHSALDRNNPLVCVIARRT